MPDQGSRYANFLTGITATLGLILLSVTTVYVFVYVIGQDTTTLKEITRQHFLALTGVPLSAISATLVLAMFRAAQGNIEFEALSFKFKGASGPTVLWIFCFLSLVAALRLLWGQQ